MAQIYISRSKSLPVRSESRPRLIVIFPALGLVLLLAALDQTIVATALPTIVSEIGGVSHLSWIVTAYLLATTIVTPLYGKLGDLFGRKLILQSAVAILPGRIGAVRTGAEPAVINRLSLHSGTWVAVV